MKIKDAWVDDPAFRGVVEYPQLCVEVDELPDVTIEPAEFSGGWTVGKYGPFVKYTQSLLPEETDAGDFNVRFRGRFPSIVDISLFKTGEELSYEGYAINLSRARQLLRKWQPQWRLLLADKDAQSGKIIWRPVDSNPVCRFYDGNNACRNPKVAGTVRIKGVELPFCREHIQAWNQSRAAMRTTSK